MDEEIIKEQIIAWESSKRGKYKGKVVAYYWDGKPVLAERFK